MIWRVTWNPRRKLGLTMKNNWKEGFKFQIDFLSIFPLYFLLCHRLNALFLWSNEWNQIHQQLSKCKVGLYLCSQTSQNFLESKLKYLCQGMFSMHNQLIQQSVHCFQKAELVSTWKLLVKLHGWIGQRDNSQRERVKTFTTKSQWEAFPDFFVQT